MVEATSADVILRVVDPTKLQVVAPVPFPDLARIQVGKPVRVLVPGADEPEDGKVLTRPAAVDQTGVAADVRIAFDALTGSRPARRFASRSSPNNIQRACGSGDAVHA